VLRCDSAGGIRPLGKNHGEPLTCRCPDTLRGFHPTLVYRRRIRWSRYAPPNPETFRFRESSAADIRVPSHHIIIVIRHSLAVNSVLSVATVTSRLRERCSSRCSQAGNPPIHLDRSGTAVLQRGSHVSATSSARRSRSGSATAGGRRTCVSDLPLITPISTLPSTYLDLTSPRLVCCLFRPEERTCWVLRTMSHRQQPKQITIHPAR